MTNVHDHFVNGATMASLSQIEALEERKLCTSTIAGACKSDWIAEIFSTRIKLNGWELTHNTAPFDWFRVSVLLKELTIEACLNFLLLIGENYITNFWEKVLTVS